MSRTKLPQEIETRRLVDEAIKQASQMKSIPYFPPAYLVQLLKARGIIVTRQYITRRYGEAGIIFDSSIGLWVKGCEQE